MLAPPPTLDDPGPPADAPLILTSQEREQRRVAAVRASLRHDRVLRRAVVVAVAWLLVEVAGVVVVLLGASRYAQDLLDAINLLPLVVGTALALTAGRRAPSRPGRRFWRIMGVGFCLFVTAQVAWTVQALTVGREQTSLASWPDVFLIAGYACFLGAIVSGLRWSVHLRLWSTLLNASILVATVSYVLWTWAVVPQLGSSGVFEAFVAIAYPAVDICALVLLAALSACAGRALSVSVSFVGVGVLIQALTDVAFVTTTASASATANVLTLGWGTAAVCLCLGALVAIRHDEGVQDVEIGGQGDGFALTVAGVAAAGLVAFAESLDGAVSMAANWLLIYAVAVLVVRQHLSIRQRARITVQLHSALEEQQRLSVTDALTGLHNRRFFEEMLGLEVRRAQRAMTTVMLYVIDLDHFKEVNDRHGHQVGDLVLREAAHRLAGAMRGTNVVARYGGEEFVVLVTQPDGDGLEAIGERLRAAVAGPSFGTGDGVPVTASVGAAALPDHAATAEELVRAADRAVYRAKDRGRNRVELAEPPAALTGDGTAHQQAPPVVAS